MTTQDFLFSFFLAKKQIDGFMGIEPARWLAFCSLGLLFIACAVVRFRDRRRRASLTKEAREQEDDYIKQETRTW